MLYHLLKFPARVALRFYCRHITIEGKDALKTKGPLLIACNHPNSFLDAVILATLFEQPIVSLARGDAFKNKIIFKILRALNILPVYRLSEGSENLHTNYSTFEQCRNIFRNNGIVLIFSEGLCINEWKLRPLKKGTARLAISSWKENIPLSILPVGINYHSFTSFGKKVYIRFGESFSYHDFSLSDAEGNIYQQFNQKLKAHLLPLVDHIEKDDTSKWEQTFDIKKIVTSPIKPLFLPAILGKYFHAPLYIPLRFFVKKYFLHSGHYDAVLTGLLLITYPIYLFMWALLISHFFGTIQMICMMPVFPLLAKSYLHWKKY